MLQNPKLTRIGGLDKHGKPIVVQIDETHCGKMKYHKGKPRVSTWVLGGIEMPAETDPPQKVPRSWAMTVPNRKKATLIPVLKYKIKEETIIWSDGWSSYFCLGSHFEDWNYVNHTRHFKDPVTGINTNRCEGNWKWLKDNIPDGSPREKIEEYVQLYNFKQWIKNHEDIGNIGYFGLLGRANQQVVLQDKASKGDHISNMVTSETICFENPLPEPPISAPSTSVPRRGRPPSKRRRRSQQQHEI